MALVGDYNASTFVAGNYATYPPLPAGATLYQPSMWWRVSVAGTVQGQACVVNDLLFATQGAGRLYGDALYGDGVFGGTADGDWIVSQVYFLRWDSTQAPPDTAPYPNAGCEYTRDGLPGGAWAPGWRIVIDAFYADATGSRTYGADTFGSGVYGDVNNAGGVRWVDITSPGFRVETGDGTTTGTQRVPVAELVVTLVDTDGRWFDLAEPSTWYQPQPGTPIRVGFLDPVFAYHPLIVGEIERIEDVHDGNHPRVVALRGFGQIMDLTVDVAGVQRPGELASDRFKHLTQLAGWTWDNGVVDFPPGDSMLLADDSPSDITVRDEIDRTVQSVGWIFDSDRRGRMRVRTWPHEPEGDVLIVADCLAGVPGHTLDPSTRVAHAIVYVNDESQLLNRVVTSNAGQPSLNVQLDDTVSQSRFGKRGRALDYPKTGLAWSSPTDAAVWARRVLNRFSYITRHVESFDVDTALDKGWLGVLADLDTGRWLWIERRGLAPYFYLVGVVTGWRHVIEPGRWRSTIFTATSTPSM